MTKFINKFDESEDVFYTFLDLQDEYGDRDDEYEDLNFDEYLEAMGYRETTVRKDDEVER